ncbi:MAG TPA: DUF6655 family protein [Candidatus Acidoferrum sp.]|nr:DUF6655 family protein [Candidatus Acidoferrum sp.]
MLLRVTALSFLLLLGLAGCSTPRESEPPRTATEQLLISTAVDRALDGLQLKIPEGTKLWVDATDFDGYDQKYAVGAIRDRLLHEGARLVADRGQADAVVEIRAGALSTNSDDLLIGLPSMVLPIPLAGPAKTPELALAKKDHDEGVAKIGITAYDAKTGALESYSPAAPIYGYSSRTRWMVLSLVRWGHSDIPPDK